jgi:hypothetical protein
MQGNSVINRRALGFAIVVVLSTLSAPSWAKDKSAWDGTWTGAWGGRARTSVQISNNKVVRYEYQGAPVPIVKQKVSANSVSFGSSTYTVTLTLTGPSTATASYSGAQGEAAADLMRQ